MKLHFNQGSPFSRKVRIVLAEKGLAYDPWPADDMPSPTLVVPVLEDRGQRIWESDTICDYLLRTYPEAGPGAEELKLSPWLARPDRHWQDMNILATIATCASSIINVRFLAGDGITPALSDYLGKQLTRAQHCLDWLETQVTDEGFAPGWFSVMDISFITAMVYVDTRGLLPWRGRPKLDALFERHQTRASMLATQISPPPDLRPRYAFTRMAIP